MVYYFLEEKYGAEKLNDFWRESLEAGRPGAGRAPFETPFQKVFNKPVAELEAEWRAFWRPAHAPPKPAAPRGGEKIR